MAVFRPKNKKARKVPTYFVATENWKEAAINVRHWYQKISHAERKIEGTKWQQLPVAQQRRMKAVVQAMMMDINRVIVPTLPASTKHPSQRQITQQSNRQLDESIASNAEQIQEDNMLETAQKILQLAPKMRRLRAMQRGRMRILQPRSMWGLGQNSASKMS